MRRQLLVGPSILQLRATKTRAKQTEDGFPVFPRLADILSGIPVPDELTPGKTQFDREAVARYVCSVLSTWAYADLDDVAMIMTRLGLEKCRCRSIELSNNGALIKSTAYLVQSDCGRVALLAYRGTDPFDISTWAVSGDLNPAVVRVQPPRTARKKPEGETSTVHEESRARRRVVPFLGNVVGSALDAVRGIATVLLPPRTAEDAEASNASVHAGFYRNQRATWFEIADALDSAVQTGSIFVPGEHLRAWSEQESRPAQPIGNAQPLQHLYITGHSLGAAMALLAGYRIARDQKAYRAIDDVLRHVHAFAPPMVGNEAFATAFDKRLDGRASCYVFKRDVVPHLPPKLKGSIGFVHVGKFYEVPEKQAQKPANECSWEAARVGPARAESPGQLLLAFDASFGDQVSLSSALLSVLRRPALEKLTQGVFGRLIEERQYAIYDHFPTHYEACSQLPNRMHRTELGNDF